jgi:hypothetical protein
MSRVVLLGVMGIGTAAKCNYNTNGSVYPTKYLRLGGGGHMWCDNNQQNVLDWFKKVMDPVLRDKTKPKQIVQWKTESGQYAYQ